MADELLNRRGTDFICAVENPTAGCSDFFIARSFESKIEFLFTSSGIDQVPVRIYEGR